MAEKKVLHFTYSIIDQIFRLSMGETGDFSGARYDGEMTLEEAQKAKHEFVPKSLHIKKASKVLDLGCGGVFCYNLKFRKFNLKKYWLYLRLVPNFLTDKEFRHRIAIFRTSPNIICFEQKIMDHYRLVFEKVRWAQLWI
jgi:hypothetical protein